mmetsp:Transcript_35120/g.46571  ORF Transcript_35120/g.46571 Transcript_35120/m.46571 type:complete len:706 (+) Transcript_35120:70-2187(+)
MESTTDDQQHTVMFDSDNIQQTGGGTHDSSSRWQKATYDAKSIRQKITFSGRKFDVKTLPVDLYRVYETLKIRSGEEYALTNVFMIRTAIELHRAWHNTLLTAKILQQLKDKFQVRMTWELGVIKLKFHVEDGSHELQYKVPYDYDSEFQDLYMRIAIAYLDEHITVHQGLIYQDETKAGKHTAKTGLFIRAFPGRLVVYPFEAATCAVIFFGGDWYDFGVTALTGFVSGLIEYLLVTIGGSAKLMVDVIVGVSTGLIASLFYRYDGEHTCLPAVFLGTLYWFFYGTAFVLGILEIISGELQTGVVRFLAVAVKTFILSLGTSFGMQIVLDSPKEVWFDTVGNCGTIDLSVQWWRIPLYLACSASALAQYRFPHVDYWRGLSVQLVGYEVQYQVFLFLRTRHSQDLQDTAAANLLGAIGAVVFAAIMSYFVESITYYYHARVLQRHKGKFSPFGEFCYKMSEIYIRITNCLGFGKKNDVVYLRMAAKLKEQREEMENPAHSRTEIMLTLEEEIVFIEAIVQAEDLNIWALLMPTLYQLVPGSLIARLWFNTIFLPPLDSECKVIDGTDYNFVKPVQSASHAVFESLLVTAVSLALGTLIGFGVVEYGTYILTKLFCCKNENQQITSDPNASADSIGTINLRKSSRNFFSHTINENNPSSDLYTIDENDPASDSERNTEDTNVNEEAGFDDDNITETNNDLLQPLL